MFLRIFHFQKHAYIFVDIYMHIYIYICVCVCVCVFVCVCVCVFVCVCIKLDGNYTRMLQALLNKSWRQHTTKQQLNGHLPSITKTTKVRQTRRAGHSRRSNDELISDILPCTPSQGRAKAGRPARTYVQRSVPIQDIVWKTSRERWTIETDGERASGT